MQSWDDRNTGEKRSKLKLKGRRIQALMPKQNSEQQQPQQRAPQAPPPPPFPTQEPEDTLTGLEAGSAETPDVPF
jgi:hypothetical protein